MDVNGFLAEPIMFHYQFCYLQLILHCFGVKHFHSWQLFWKKGFIGLSKKGPGPEVWNLNHQRQG